MKEFDFNLDDIRLDLDQLHKEQRDQWFKYRFHRAANNHDRRIPRNVRIDVLTRANGKCELCGDKGSDIHHVSYPGYGNETADDLMLLCRPCHKSQHFLG